MRQQEKRVQSLQELYEENLGAVGESYRSAKENVSWCHHCPSIPTSHWCRRCVRMAAYRPAAGTRLGGTGAAGRGESRAGRAAAQGSADGAQVAEGAAAGGAVPVRSRLRAAKAGADVASLTLLFLQAFRGSEESRADREGKGSQGDQPTAPATRPHSGKFVLVAPNTQRKEPPSVFSPPYVVNCA